MCEGSIHVAHRNGRRQEHLVVRSIRGHSGIKGFYPADKKAIDQRLVCMKERVRVDILEVRLEPGLPGWMTEFEGRKNVAVQFVHSSWGDLVFFPDAKGLYDRQRYVRLFQFREGTLFDFGYAPKKCVPA